MRNQRPCACNDPRHAGSRGPRRRYIILRWFVRIAIDGSSHKDNGRDGGVTIPSAVPALATDLLRRAHGAATRTPAAARPGPLQRLLAARLMNRVDPNANHKGCI